MCSRGCSSSLAGRVLNSELPSWKRGYRAACQWLLAWLQGSWRLCTVAGLFALQTERYTNTSSFVYSHKCPAHRVALRAGLANLAIQQAGRQN